MTSKRKAEIQRKLSLTAVPRPPEDLLDRIKGDIPRYLSVEAERERFSRSVGFNLRVAASILVLISVAAALFMLVPDNKPAAFTASRMKEEAPRPVAAPASTDEVRVDIVQQQQAPPATSQIADAAPPPAVAVMRPAPMMVPEPSRRRDADAEREVRGVEGGVEGGVPGGVVGGVIGGVAGGTVGTAPVEVAEAPAAPEPPPAAAASAEDFVRAERAAPAAAMAKTANSSSLIPQAFADELQLAPKSVFGISVDPAAFRRIKSTIENGAHPSPSTSDVEALVNYFAGGPSGRVRGVRLEAEASPQPVDANGHRAILRLTIDTSPVSVPPGGSIPPIATDARLEIDFNENAIQHYEAIGDNTMLVPESALLHNLSVTGLWALDLKTPLKAKQRVATIHLHYRSLADKKEHTIVRELRGSDFANQWANASRRHRLASLGALWGESLRGSKGGPDVAKRAEELASQAPNDTRAQELAAVANASSGGGTK
jgi:hypothetical protein